MNRTYEERIRALSVNYWLDNTERQALKDVLKYPERHELSYVYETFMEKIAHRINIATGNKER